MQMTGWKAPPPQAHRVFMWAADVRYFNEGKGDIFYGFPMEDMMMAGTATLLCYLLDDNVIQL